MTDEREELALSSYITSTLGDGTFLPPPPPPPPLLLPAIVPAMMEVGTDRIMILTALLLLLYAFILGWPYWSVAGVLASKREWLISLLPLFDRISHFYKAHENVPRSWKRHIEGLDKHCKR